MIPDKFKLALLIDDNQIDNIINKRILENHNFVEKIITYQSAKDAMDYLKTNSDNSELFPDFILLDIRMPEMDGFQFLAEFENIQSHYKARCSIFILSSSLDPIDQRKVAENKYVVKFLGKPLTGPHLNNLQIRQGI